MGERVAQRKAQTPWARLRKGLPFQQALELVRERYVFLPSEEDQPELGSSQ